MARKKKRKIIIKLVIWLLFLVGVPLILMGFLLSDSSKNSLMKTSSFLGSISKSYIKNTSDRLINISGGILHKSLKNSSDLSNKTINNTSESLVNLSKQSLLSTSNELSALSKRTIKDTNDNVGKVTETAIRNTGNNLINLSKESLGRAVIQTNEEKADNIAKEIYIKVVHSQEVLQLFAGLADVKKLDPIALNSIFTSMQKKFPELSNIAITDKTGLELAKVSIDEAVYASDLKDISSSPEFASAARGKLYVSDVKISKRQYPYVKLGIPIQLYPGKYVGTIVADLNLSSIESLLSDTKIGKSGYIFILDHDGQIIFHPDKQLMLKKANLSSNPIVKSIKSGNNDKKVFTLNDGTEVLGLHSTVKSLGWNVIIVEPTAEAFSVVKDMQNQINSQTNNTLGIIRATADKHLAMAVSSMESKAINAAKKSENVMNEEAKKQVSASIILMNKVSEEASSSAVNELKPVAEQSTSEAMEELNAKSVNEASSSQQKNTLNSILLIVSFVSIAGVIAFFIAKNIANPFQKLTKVANRIADEDLTEKLQIEDIEDEEIDDLFQAFGKMQTNLKDIVGQIFDGASQMSAAAEELTAITDESSRAIEQVSMSIQDVAEGAETQAIMSEKSYLTACEISEKINKVNDNILNMSELSNSTAEKSLEGNENVKKAILQIKEINEKVIASSLIVNDLGIKSKEINNMTVMISKIAQQTGLLSLNASIEAARAGKDAKGFSVIAAEVRNLAQQTSTAAKQIGTIIKEINTEVIKANISMEEGIEAVKVGNMLIDEAGNSFEEISTAVKDVSQKANNVAKDAGIITSGVQEIVQSIEHISNISKQASDNTQTVAAAVQQQTASSQEIAATSQVLAGIAEKLAHIVQIFKL
ncbi:MAG: methyl-accepting chemotaxis protein [bacterium]